MKYVIILLLTNLFTFVTLDQNQFLLSFATTFFCAIYNRYKDKVLISSENSIVKWKIAKKLIQKGAYILRKIHVDYIVWIYHMAVFTLLSIDKPDPFSPILFLANMIIFTLHIKLSWGGKNTQKKQNLIRRFWYPGFFFVLVLIFFRYISFYLRFEIIKSFLCGEKTNNCFLKTLIQENGTNATNSSKKLNNLSDEFLIEILLLGVAFVTLTGLQKNREEYLNGNDSDKKVLKFLNEMERKTGQLILQVDEKKLLEIKNQILKEEEDFEASKNGTNLSSSGSSISDGDALENIPFDINFSQKMSFVGKNDSREESFKEKFSDPDKLFEGWNLIYFVCFFILFRSTVFIVIIIILAVQLDTTALDITFVAADLLFFNVLFWNFSSVFKLFNIETYIKMQLDYFNNGFVRLMNEHDAFPTFFGEEKVDLTLKNISHNRHYIKQLMKKLEIEIVNTTTNVSVLKLCVIVFSTARIFMEKFEVFGPKEAGKNYTKECIGRIIIISFMLIELILMNNFLASNQTLKEQKPRRLAHFLVLLTKKLEYLNFFTKTKLKHMNYYLKNKHTNSKKWKKKKNYKKFKMNGQTMNDEESVDEQKVRILKMNQDNIWRREKKDDLNYVIIKRRTYLNALNLYEKQNEKDEFDVLSPDDFYFDKIENCSLDFIQAKNKDKTKRFKLRVVMDEGTSKMKKFLFIHRNKHKLNFCQVLWGIKSCFRRLILIPLLYSSFTVQNPINIFVLIPCWFYSFKSSYNLESDIKVFLPIFSLIFTIFFSYGQLLKAGGSLILIGKLIPAIQNDYNSKSKNALPFFSGFILAIALYYIVSISLLYFVSFRLFMVRKRFKTLFFYFRDDKNIRKIYLNFKSWQKSGLSIFTSLYEMIFENSGSYYLILVFVLSILQTTKMNLIFLVGVIILTLFELIKRLNKYSLNRLKPRRLKRITR